MPKGEELSKDTIKAMQALREKGVSARKTAILLNVGVQSVQRHAPIGTYPVDSTKTKKDRDEKLEKIIDLSGERLVDVLESKEKIGPVALNTVMGTAWDKRYGKEHTSGLSPQNLLINLFGASGVGEQMAANLTAMLPKAKVIDATAVDVTDDEKDPTPGPGLTQEE